MIKFYKRKNIYFALSIVFILVGIIALFINGVQLSIQFKGGAILKYSYNGDIDINNVSKLVSETLNRTAEVQVTKDVMTDNKMLEINLAGNSGLNAIEQEKLDYALKFNYNENDFELSESNVVEPFIGRRFFEKGLFAIALAFLMIVVYVWKRFKRISGLSAGLVALLALVHDVFIVFFVFVIFRIPLNESFIAVILTIIGYSINDTIVIYDRIRENKKLYPKMIVEELVDLSINQSLTRSINTSLTTVLSVMVLYIFASLYNIESIKIFALPMMFGLASGCYSTICIAGPIWTMIQKRKHVKKIA